MRLFAWLALLLVLVLALLAVTVHRLNPGLLLGSPWGTVPVVVLLGLGFALGLAVAGLFFVAAWWKGWRLVRLQKRELRNLKQEIDRLKESHPEEVPVIPDRQEWAQ